MVAEQVEPGQGHLDLPVGRCLLVETAEERLEGVWREFRRRSRSRSRPRPTGPPLATSGQPRVPRDRPEPEPEPEPGSLPGEQRAVRNLGVPFNLWVTPAASGSRASSSAAARSEPSGH